METEKDCLDIIQSVLTSFAIVAAGLWALYQYRRHREDSPHIEFSADIIFHSKIGNWWIVELTAIAENKGKVRHEIYNLDFDLASISANDPILPSPKFGNQVHFPNILTNGSFMRPDMECFFIEPGIKCKYSHVTQVPLNAELIILHTWFKYNNKKESHTAEKTVKVPKDLSPVEQK